MSSQSESPKIPQYYVGIGASAGGLEALDAFFTNMPTPNGMALIVIQHLSPDYKSLMVELLSKRTRMEVLRATEGMEVFADHVYLIPPGKELTIFHGKLLLKDQQHGKGLNLPIDTFFSSLAIDQGEKSIAVILSGTGSDGARGIRSIKESGGIIIVQSESSARFDGMPRSAISTGLADIILPPEEMPEAIGRISRRTGPFVAEVPRPLVTDEEGLTRIFAILRDATKVDFTFYKPNTVMRRIERRMTVNQASEMRDYVRILENNSSEVKTLFRELLIGVTSFFRDPEAFDELSIRYLPELFAENEEKDELRFWVPGCSTGEEAYSLAILAREVLERLDLKLKVKIFATDLDSEAVLYAGTGKYPESIAADMPSNILNKYFILKDEYYQISSLIREMVVFAQHNLAKDPPFTNIDLISCRNLLIYFQPVLQNKVIDFFNFSLNEKGILFLGSSETPGDDNEIFETLSHKHRIFKSRGRKNPGGAGFSFNYLRSNPLRSQINTSSRVASAMVPREEEKIMDRIISQLAEDLNYLLAVVDENMNLLFLAGKSRGIFHLPMGRMVNDISKMVPTELAIPLATGLQKVFQNRDAIKYINLRVPSDNDNILLLDLSIQLIHGNKNYGPKALIVISETASAGSSPGLRSTQVFNLSEEAEQRIKDLEQDLQFTKENLQATIEELETSNEELQATNEELLASNEELQSTNEELQSVNEELHTVNYEYQSKIIELVEKTNDLDNLLKINDIAVVFLDENMDVRFFSSGSKVAFDISESDVGRPFSHLNHRFVNLEPSIVARQVLNSGNEYSNEIILETGKWVMMRVVPYRSSGDRINGIVISFSDISSLKKSSILLEKEQKQLLSIFDSIDHIIYVSDIDTYEILYTNKTTQEYFGSDLAGKKCYRVFQGIEHPCDFCTNPKLCIQPDKPVKWEFYNQKVKVHYRITDRLIDWPDGRRVRFELAEDITDYRRAISELERTALLLERTQELTQTGGWEWDVLSSTMFWTDQTYRIHGLDPQSIEKGSQKHIERSLECYSDEDKPLVKQAFGKCCSEGIPYSLSCRFTDFNGNCFLIETSAQATVVDGQVTRVTGIIKKSGR